MICSDLVFKAQNLHILSLKNNESSLIQLIQFATLVDYHYIVKKRQSLARNLLYSFSKINYRFRGKSQV